MRALRTPARSSPRRRRAGSRRSPAPGGARASPPPWPAPAGRGRAWPGRSSSAGRRRCRRPSSPAGWPWPAPPGTAPPHLARPTWRTGNSSSAAKRSPWTGCPESTERVGSVTNRAAVAVRTTRTSAPSSRSRRSTRGALYAAMPPLTPSRTRRPSSLIRIPPATARPAGPGPRDRSGRSAGSSRRSTGRRGRSGGGRRSAGVRSARARGSPSRPLCGDCPSRPATRRARVARSAWTQSLRASRSWRCIIQPVIRPSRRQPRCLPGALGEAVVQAPVDAAVGLGAAPQLGEGDPQLRRQVAEDPAHVDVFQAGALGEAPAQGAGAAPGKAADRDPRHVDGLRLKPGSAPARATAPPPPWPPPPGG